MLAKPEAQDFQSAWCENPKLIYMTRECATCGRSDGIVILNPQSLHRFNHCTCTESGPVSEEVNWQGIADHYNSDFHQPKIKAKMKQFWFPAPTEVTNDPAE